MKETPHQMTNRHRMANNMLWANYYVLFPNVSLQSGKIPIGWSPDFLDEWDDVEKELFGQFWFSTDHETLEETTPLRDELVNGVLRQTDGVAQINRSDVVQFPFLDHLLEYLCTECLCKYNA